MELPQPGGDPGNAIVLNGIVQTANREIGVPGFPPRQRTKYRKIPPEISSLKKEFR